MIFCKQFIFFSLILTTTGIASPVTYKHYSNPDLPLAAHILYVDPSKADIKLVKAQGFLNNREDVLSIAERTGACAAINGGFFRRNGANNGFPMEFLVAYPDIAVDPCFVRGTIWWGNKGSAISRLQTSYTITVNNQVITAHRFNHPCGDDEIVIYSDSYNASTLTNHRCEEITIYQGKIVAISDHGNSPLQKNHFVVSFGPLAEKSILHTLEVGMIVNPQFECLAVESAFSLDAVECAYAVGGTPTLMLNGTPLTAEQMIEEFGQGKRVYTTADEVPADFHDKEQAGWLINGEHPRTAVGLTKEGMWVFVVVEGRSKESKGISLPALAQFMKELGCDSAINLGGGGDSAMIVHNQLVSQPSGASQTPQQDKRLRPLSNAFCVFCDEQVEVAK